MTEFKEDAIIGRPLDIITDLSEAIRRGWIDDDDYLELAKKLIEICRGMPDKTLECVYKQTGTWNVAPLDTH